MMPSLTFLCLRSVSLLVVALAIIAMATPALATPNARRGKAFAQANCAQCHAVDRTSRSRVQAAPPFRTLHSRYPVETLEDALIEGLSTGHPRMPEFHLGPGELRDFIAYLKSLDR